MSHLKTIKNVINEALNEVKIADGTWVAYKDFISIADKEEQKGLKLGLKKIKIKDSEAVVILEQDGKTKWKDIIKELKAQKIPFAQINVFDGNIAILAKSDLGKIS